MSRSDALVLFGATGDLARKKLFSSLYRLAARGRLDLPVIGDALSDWDNDQFRAHVREAIAATVADADADVVDRLCEGLSLIGATTPMGPRSRSSAWSWRGAAPAPRPSTWPSLRRSSRQSPKGSLVRV